MSPPAMDSNSDCSLTVESTVQHLNKGVKRLSDNGVKKLPRKYILPGTERPGLLDPARSCDIRLPLIDVSDLMGPARPDALARLGRACGEYGFFQVVGHGVDAGAVSAMLDVCRRFFEMPLEEREKYMSADMSAPVRCGTSFNQTKDRVFSWRDFLKLVVDPDSNDVVPLWPSSPTDFRTSALTYSKETKKLFMVLMEAIIESLGLSFTKVEEEGGEQEDEIQIEDFQKGSQIMVSNCYPPCPEPELTLGMPPHSDYGFLTLLLQDSVKGLQIQHKGKWVTVEPIPNSFVVNVGDHLEIFSNGRYKSVLHRVLVNSERTRITVASLHSLPFNHVIKPSTRLVDDMNPSLYMETDFATFLEYISSREPKKKNFLESRKILYHSN
ncbi:hypothetical protein V2J09_009648 [Rumex salicifolius]